VFTQTMPALLAGGVCCALGVEDFEVEADLVDPLAEPEELAGALEGAGAGVEAGAGAGAGLEAGVELAVEPEAEPDAGADESAVAASDFLVRFFLVVVALESVELSALAELAAG
jgi:hypothetical protein